ncbi:MAG: choice-of-anchor D domain-containing protein [Acidobacteriaceae bacterium]|nr:choice-of-anchor D domain-containing protein [Acidobacteriaceae bacterium]
MSALGGKVFGGQQPIKGAAMTLWAAGTTGTYGTAASLVATTTTDANGSFGFNNGTTGASPCITGQHLYITALGGDSGSGTNQYIAQIAALPTPCGSSTANTFVVVNEATTVATVTALQQFMSIAPGSSPAWTIGAPAGNITGLANAFLQVGNLVNIGTGTSGSSTATSTINSVTYTTTITPDSTKINTLADIIAACVNTAGSSLCTSLLADATPSGSVAPTDTLQAMYYLATNAGGVNLPAHGATQGEPYYLCSTYVIANAPFQPSSTCSSSVYPTDWAIGVSWNTSNGAATVGTATPYSLAIDGGGNIWTAYSCGASSNNCTDTANDTHNGKAYVTEFNPQGQVQFTPVSSTTLTAGPGLTSAITGTTYSLLAGEPFSLAIDTSNNAWFDSYWGANPLSSTSSIGGVVTQITPAGASTGYVITASAPGAMAIDASNNIWLDDAPSYNSGNRYYLSELEYQSGAYSTFDIGLGRQTVVFSGVWADSLGYGWSAASTAAKCGSPTGTIYRATTAEMEAAATTDDVTNVAVCPVWTGAADPTGGAFYANGGLYHLTISGGTATKSAPVMVTEAAGTGTTNGGLDGGAGAVVDGLGNVWVANGAGGVSAFSYNGSAFNPLSPAGTASVPVYGFGSSYLSGTNPINVATDASGNVWVGTQTTNLWYLVGIAGPTVTPTSQMLKTNFIGSRPGALTLVSLSPALTYNSVASVGEPMTATLTNTGTATVNISGITIGGTNSGDFNVSSTTCRSTLAIGANCTITVTFNSATAGTFAGTLNVASNAAGSPASVNLTGTASASAGTINLQAGTVPPSGPALSFGTVVAPTTTTGQAVILSNTGSTAMSLTLGMTGTGANLFPETTSCGSSLAAGASCFVSFKFSPKVAGGYSAALTVTNDAGTGQGATLSGTATPFTITVNTSNASAWVIDNGAITFNWNSTAAYLNSWVLDGYSDQLVDTTTLGSGSQIEGLYSGMVGPFMNGTSTASCTAVGATVTGTTTCTTGSGTTPYFDWAITWLDTASTSNAYTFVWHYVVFPNDPGVHTYVQLIHATSDIAGSVGQIQWIFRDNQSIFTHTYEVNSSLNWLGAEDIPLFPWNDSLLSDTGRTVQNAATDLHGDPNVTASYGRWFETKYDYAGYEYLHQAHGLYGPATSGTTYGVWTVLPKLETLVGGPTKQNLWFTGNIDMIEAYSNHENNNLSLATAAGAASNRVFGPYYIHVNTLGQAYSQTGTTLASQADMYADAISSESALVSNYDNVAPLMAAGYTPSTGRGSVSIQVNGVAGATHTAWAVLSDPNTNFQYSSQGMQYWADISQSGSATISGVVPGTYRLSVYALGQWGEYRQDGIVVTANNNTVVPTVTFQPENFTSVNGVASGETVFTIGTPDRSSHEFLHGHNTATGNDDREYWGNWNYWQDFASNQGAVIYYATAVGSTPATNDLSKWNYVHWSTFNPGLFAGVFSSSDDTTDGYSAYPGQTYTGVTGNGVGGETAIPTYVASLSGASGTNGATTGIPSWQIYFATPSDISSYKSGYAQLSISSACTYGSYVVTLNGHELIWHYTNYSDCMIRSGLSGYTQWFVMEFPASYLNQTAGGSNEITASMSGTGSEDDAWRLELTNNTSNPTVTGWNDYTYVIGTNYPGTGTANSSGLYNNDAVNNP